jgi:hypothetical protein
MKHTEKLDDHSALSIRAQGYKNQGATDKEMSLSYFCSKGKMATFYRRKQGTDTPDEGDAASNGEKQENQNGSDTSNRSMTWKDVGNFLMSVLKVNPAITITIR